MFAVRQVIPGTVVSQLFASSEANLSVVTSNSIVWGFCYQTIYVFLPFQRRQKGENERGKEGERKRELEGVGNRG